MKFNCEVKNGGPLPISYVWQRGESIVVGTLYKDRPLYPMLQFVTCTSAGQIELRTDNGSYIFTLSPDLTILPLWDTKSQTATAPDKTKQA